jgi:aspartate-semialdehyde dehydrogenase
VAIVGAASLDAREILDGLTLRGWKKEEILTFGERVGGWELDVEDEAAEVYLPLQEEYLTGCDPVFLCAPNREARDFVLEWAKSSGCTLYDLTCPPGSTEAIWSPFEADGGVGPERGNVLAFPEPESLLLAMTLGGLSPEQVGRVDCTLLQPSSIRGEQGVRELLRQSTDVLNFRPVVTDALGHRLAFSLVPAGGGTEESPFGRQVERLLGWTLPLSWTAVGVPVFHGMVLSSHLETGDALEAEQAVWNSAKALGLIDRFPGEDWVGPGDGSVPERPLLGTRPLSDRILWIWLWFDQVKSGKPWMALRALGLGTPGDGAET